MTKQLLVVIARPLWTSHTQSYTAVWDFAPHKAALCIWALKGSGHVSYQFLYQCCFYGPSFQGRHACSCNLESLLSTVQTSRIKKVSQRGQIVPPHSRLTAWPGGMGGSFPGKTGGCSRWGLWAVGKDGGCAVWWSSAFTASLCMALSKRQLNPGPQVWKIFRKGQYSVCTPLPIKLVRYKVLAVETQLKDNLYPSVPSQVSCWTMVPLFIHEDNGCYWYSVSSSVCVSNKKLL